MDPALTRWKGEIDEAAVFNRALSTAEVALLYMRAPDQPVCHRTRHRPASTRTPNPSVVGQPITVRATVTATTPPTGTLGGSIVVVMATHLQHHPWRRPCAITPASAGTITLNARYSGDGYFRRIRQRRWRTQSSCRPAINADRHPAWQRRRKRQQR